MLLQYLILVVFASVARVNCVHGTAGALVHQLDGRRLQQQLVSVF